MQTSGESIKINYLYVLLYLKTITFILRYVG